jgi:sugar O-acyltransferase (sialic acid O-acetyltransferase NeuD family)
MNGPAGADQVAAIKIALFGAGGHAKVVLEALWASRPGQHPIVVDDAPANHRSLLGISISGGREALSAADDVVVVPAIGLNASRADLLRWLKEVGIPIVSVVHPAAVLSPTARIGGGCFLAPGAIVNAEAVLEDGVIINTGASVDHDCFIGFCAHVAPGSRLCGGVSVGAMALVGAGSVLIPGIRVGAGAVIGAGSVVVRDVPAGATVAGCPAYPLKPYSAASES